MPQEPRRRGRPAERKRSLELPRHKRPGDAVDLNKPNLLPFAYWSETNRSRTSRVASKIRSEHMPAAD